MRYAFLVITLAISMLGAPSKSSAQNLDGRVSAMIGLIATTAIAVQQQQNGRRPPAYGNHQSNTYQQERYGRYDQSAAGRQRAPGGVDNRYGGGEVNRPGVSGHPRYDQGYANATGSQIRPRCWLEVRQVMQGDAPTRPRRLRVCED